MLSINSNVFNEVVIKKSRFITFLYRVDDISSVSFYLDDLNSKYKDASHICYAYIIDNVKRFSDNGEPGGTAGMPILGVLESKSLDHILCCVVRYFGGVKLGANGLVRAYSSSVSECVSCASFVNLVPGYIFSISFNYDDTRVIDSLLCDCIIINKVYNDSVCYKFMIDCDLFKVKESELYKYGVLNRIDSCYIEKNI